MALTITPDAPLRYRAQDDKSEIEHTVSLSRSTIRGDEFYDEQNPEPKAPADTVVIQYFVGESQHGTFEVSVRCRREGFQTSFEVEAVDPVDAVAQLKNVEITQIPTFTITEDKLEDPNDPVIAPAD